MNLSTARPRKISCSAALAMQLFLSVLCSVARADVDILFAVFPSTVTPEKHGERVAAARETWAKGEKVVFVSREAEEHGDAEVWTIPELGDHDFSGEQTYRKFLERSLSERWDWLMRVDDISVVFPANLRHLLLRFKPDVPVLMGSKLVLPGANKIYFSAGPGWVISRKAVENYIDNWCTSSSGGFKTRNYDIIMHDCMVRNQNVIAESPRDADGGAVFNAYGPVRSFIGPYDDWFKNYKKGGHEDVFNGSFCCAAYPVSFHYVDAHEQRNIYSIVTEKDKWLSIPHDRRAEVWNQGDMNPYSKKIPSGDHPVWDLLLYKFRAYSSLA